MPESSIYDYLAEDHDDAAERQVLELFQAGLLNAPIAVAMMELGIPGLLADQERPGRTGRACPQRTPGRPGGSGRDLGLLRQPSRQHRQVLPGHGLRHLTPARGHDSGRLPSAVRPRIVDVGGNRGTVLAWFLQAAPKAAGVLFDRPESLTVARGFLASAGVADRTELVPGNYAPLHEMAALHRHDDRVGSVGRRLLLHRRVALHRHQRHCGTPLLVPHGGLIAGAALRPATSPFNLIGDHGFARPWTSGSHNDLTDGIFLV